jgi:hypothetical protein
VIIDVHFRWDDRHGPCYDCSRPAAFLNSTDQRLCGVCAANHAVDGDTIRRIAAGSATPTEDNDGHGRCPGGPEPLEGELVVEGCMNPTGYWPEPDRRRPPPYDWEGAR